MMGEGPVNSFLPSWVGNHPLLRPSYLVAFAVAALMAALVTPIVRRLALRLGAVSGKGGRNVGDRVVPRLGGIAICIALFAPIAGLFLVESAVAEQVRRQASLVFGLFAGGIWMCVVGAVDDTKGLRALYKLAAQVLAAVIAYLCGFRIDAVSLPIIGEASMGVFALPVTTLWIVGITNAVNLIDGLDGLAAGVVFFAGVSNFVVAGLGDAGFVALVMASMLGALLGFLFHNFNPARIFMGDSGSYLLGYVISAASLAGAQQSKTSTAVSLLVPIVALGVPIFDTLFAMVRRFLERRPMFSPDRGHIHHRLLDVGITHRRAVLIIYGASVVFTAAAIGIYIGKSWQIGLAMAAAAIVLVTLVRFVGVFSMAHLRRRQVARLRTRETEMLRYALPSAPPRFAAAQSETDLFAALGTLGHEAELVAVEIVARGPDGTPRTVYRWSDGEHPGRRVTALGRYPLGRDALARAELRFELMSDFEDGELSPQCDILLQVVADVVTANLERLDSEFAPRSSVVPAARPSRPELLRREAAARARPARATGEALAAAAAGAEGVRTSHPLHDEP
ncbi:MAG: undecaprenyl/decaprenyl-phosphate alpha-N-acetylglucosaminyl 1-phosphate transferase [Myxococcales bacterium]|nr:undecaprenyl/decaprenyl-phosphate alpha-N-acetylglucosaminyl 1-phosphate transferase [Myxococcales bacterium]